jgi:hypothetical protein
MAAVHHFEILKDTAQSRVVLWLKDLGASVALIAFIASTFVLLDAFSALFV